MTNFNDSKQSQIFLLVNYEYCSGCHTCEIACQQVLKLQPDQFGIELKQIGPHLIGERHWQYEYIPVPTELCDRCEARVSSGKTPSCVKHCQAGCLFYGSIEEMAKQMNSNKYVLFS